VLLLVACISTRSETPSRTEFQSDLLTQYVIVRSDIPIGTAAAQIAHAAGESATAGWQEGTSPHVPEGTHAIVLGARDEEALTRVLAHLQAAKLPFRAIYEPDPPWNSQLMAIGIAPIRRQIGRRYLSCLPLYRGPLVTSKEVQPMMA
jgi:Peptidyl-tRNA hydrolase PTH2